MAGSRAAVRLTDAELSDFLAANMKVQVATVGPDGAPHLTTLFYALDDQGRITFWTYGSSQKIKNLRRDPRISCLVEDGYAVRRPSETDGRSTLVEISEKGRQMLLADRRRRDAWLAQRLKDLTPEERDLLRQVAPIIERLTTA